MSFIDSVVSFGRRIVARVMSTQPGQERVYVGQRQAGVLVSEDTALTNSAVWACVRVISETIAALPWHVYRRGEEGRELSDTHPAYWLLNAQANPEMTAFSFREALLAHALTWGNGYAEIIKDAAGRVSALWPLTPDRVCPRRRETDGSLYYRVIDSAGNIQELPPDRVLHLHGMSFDGLVGYSPVRMAARSIGLGIAQDEFGAAFYANGTTFGGMVEIPATMSPEQIKQQESYLNDAHGGPRKAFKVRVVPAGMKYTNTSMPMTDAQFIESRRFSVTEVARWYRVPPHKIADLERSTNNNIEQQAIEFVTDCLMPWVIRLEQEVNIKLFGIRAQGLIYTKLAVQALMRGDAVSRAGYYRTMTQIGAMSINEVRELEDWNSIGEDGDEHLVQLNQTTLEKLVAEPDDPADPAANSDTASPVAPASEDAASTDPAAGDAGMTDSAPNVVRAEALEWMRKQRRES